MQWASNSKCSGPKRNTPEIWYFIRYFPTWKSLWQQIKYCVVHVRRQQSRPHVLKKHQDGLRGFESGHDMASLSFNRLPLAVVWRIDCGWEMKGETLGEATALVLVRKDDAWLWVIVEWGEVGRFWIYSECEIDRNCWWIGSGVWT